MQLFRSFVAGLLVTSSSLVSLSMGAAIEGLSHRKIAPRVFIISMFEPEAEVWWGIPEFDLLAHNITVAGASPLFPDVHCTRNYEVCQLVTGEAEINAAITVASVVLSPAFDLKHTYFLIAGIAGINPKVGTISSVTFARFAVQVALQYEIDMREMPSNMTTGYIPQGSYAPDEYPTSIYGTEVFEVNAALRSMAVSFAKKAELADSDAAKQYRSLYASSGSVYAAATNAPSVIECDTATSDVYFSGHFLGETFENTTRLLTNGKGTYCSTEQEDNATLEALLRMSSHGLTDFSRIIIMRTASDFDREHPDQSAMQNLLYSEQGAFEPSVLNIYRAGIKVVEGILNEWDRVFAAGVKPSNYIGDIFGTLGEHPDFGPNKVVKRAVHSRGKRSLDINVRT